MNKSDWTRGLSGWTLEGSGSRIGTQDWFEGELFDAMLMVPLSKGEQLCCMGYCTLKYYQLGYKVEFYHYLKHTAELYLCLLDYEIKNFLTPSFDFKYLINYYIFEDQHLEGTFFSHRFF